MSEFLRSNLQKLEAYTPGEQPQDKKYIKLNTNESPFPPSKGVIKAMNSKEIEDLRLYSDPEAKELKRELSRLYNVKEQNVFVSNGSDEILNFAFMAFAEQGACFADITYGFYKVFADLYEVDADILPLKADFSLDVEGFLHKNKMIVIANPNAPTGLDIPLSDIERILDSNRENVVIIDEAYVDFGGESALSLLPKYRNLLVCRTFSKSRSMAGARLGFAFGSEEVISDLEKIKFSTNPYNINRLTQKCGAAALLENDYYMENCKKIMENRAYTERELQKLGFAVLPSKANFIFAKSDLVGGEELYLKLKEKGILIRHFKTERIKEYNRITVGSKEQMEAFVSTVKEILGEIR